MARLLEWTREQSGEVKLPQQGFNRHPAIIRDVAEDGAQRANSQRVMPWDCQTVFATGPGDQPAVRADLTRKLITEFPPQDLLQISGGKVARQLHATAISSSVTRCSRMTAGALPSSKPVRDARILHPAEHRYQTAPARRVVFHADDLASLCKPPPYFHAQALNAVRDST